MTSNFEFVNRVGKSALLLIHSTHETITSFQDSNEAQWTSNIHHRRSSFSGVYFEPREAGGSELSCWKECLIDKRLIELWWTTINYDEISSLFKRMTLSNNWIKLRGGLNLRQFALTARWLSKRFRRNLRFALWWIATTAHFCAAEFCWRTFRYWQVETNLFSGHRRHVSTKDDDVRKSVAKSSQTKAKSTPIRQTTTQHFSIVFF